MGSGGIALPGAASGAAVEGLGDARPAPVARPGDIRAGPQRAPRAPRTARGALRAPTLSAHQTRRFAVTIAGMETERTTTRAPGDTPGTTSLSNPAPTSGGRACARVGRRPRAHRSVAGRRKALLVPAALATALLIGACGSSSNETSSTGKKLDMARVVKSIEQSFLEKRHIVAHVSCPSSEEQKAGNNFVCTASGFTGSGANKKPFTVHVGVTQANDKGYVTYVSY